MSKFRKGRLASAMLCTLLFGGNAGAMQKDMSEIISKNDLFKNQNDKELENRKPDDSGNPLLKYILYVLGGAKLADEGVGVAEAKEYIQNKKFSPLGKLSIYKNLAARSYRAKTVETMRNLVAESHKNAGDIKKFFWGVLNKVFGLKNNENGCAKVKVKVKDKVKVKENLFDISLDAAGKEYLNIKEICRDAGLIEGKNPAVPEYVKECVKAVLGVSVEDCDRILVNIPDDAKYAYIAFVKGDVCLKLLPFNDDGIGFCLTCISDKLIFDNADYELELYEGKSCYAISFPYMEKILGVKHDENYKNIINNDDKVNSYSFYGQIFHDLCDDWKGMNSKFNGSVRKIFPDLFAEKEELIELKEK